MDIGVAASRRRQHIGTCGKEKHRVIGECLDGLNHLCKIQQLCVILPATALRLLLEPAEVEVSDDVPNDNALVQLNVDAPSQESLTQSSTLQRRPTP